MLSEPKRKQRNIEYLHRFVVAVHMLVSHIATLAYYTPSLKPALITEDYQPLINSSNTALEHALNIVMGDEKKAAPANNTPARLIDTRINEMIRKRQEELEQGQLESETRKELSDFKSITDQFYFINKVSMDIGKISGQLMSNVEH